MVIADAFSLSYDLLDKTTDLETGEWLFVSYKATKQRNVPIFVKTPNNEEILISNLSNKKLTVETHDKIASHSDNVNHYKIASHQAIEELYAIASQNIVESHMKDASHSVLENH